LDDLRAQGYLHGTAIYDVKSGEQLVLPEPHFLSIPACGFYYLSNQTSTS
jgi:hypothetical protein